MLHFLSVDETMIKAVKLINDLKVEPVPPFIAAEVRRFVEGNLKERGVPFDESVTSRVLEHLGSPIPFFLQMLVQEIYRFWRRDQGCTVTAQTVDLVFRKALLGEMARDKLQHYRSRIDVHYPPEDREAACLLLGQLSLSQGGASLNTLFQLFRSVEEKKAPPRTGPQLSQAFHRLLLHLQSDFYIEETDDGRYDFASRLLKNWWKKYYGYEIANI